MGSYKYIDNQEPFILWLLSFMQFGSSHSRKRIRSSRSPVKQFIRENLGENVYSIVRWITNPRKAAYNLVYNKTSNSYMVATIFLTMIGVFLFVMLVLQILKFIRPSA